jgi:hypothetical protein
VYQTTLFVKQIQKYPLAWTQTDMTSDYAHEGKGKGKGIPLQAWGGPEGSRKLRFPHFMTTAQHDGKVVSLMHQPPLTPGNTPGTHFC